MDCRIATIADKDKVDALAEAACAQMNGNITPENFKAITGPVLEDIDWGFFIICEKEGTPCGLMYFTYEWSDWRNGVFFYLQCAYADNDDAETHKALIEFLDKYQKERGCCGFRLCSEKVAADFWQPTIERLNLKPCHYYIYHIDTN